MKAVADVVRSYHQAELRIARDPNHPAHVAPPPVPEGELVLDVGCGAGQTLLASIPGRFAVGLDIDPDALALAREWSTGAVFTCGRAEMLPFEDARFDQVWARVSLAYTNLAQSLPELRRVLKPGGSAWMVLHGPSIPWHAAKGGGLRKWVYFAYIVANSVAFHLFGKMFPLAGRYESFQTTAGMRRALLRNGFGDVQVQRKRHFVIEAR